MDLNELRKLVRLMKSAELSEIEIDDANEGLRVHLKRGSTHAGEGGGVTPLVHVVPAAGSPAVVPGGEPAASASRAPGAEAPAAEGTPFESPMVGTFYRAPSPDAEPFVEVGSRVDEETVLCVIEAMKVMNEIKAETRGVVAEVLVENGEPIEFGQPLFMIREG